MISNTINFILSKQENDGSWDSSVDMTGAAMEALASFGKNTDPLPTSPGGEEISNALAKAENFLKQNQKDNGGWNDNASGTAWIIEGILAQGEKPENWIKNENTPLDYLASIQDTDGGIKDSNIQNKIWETAYVTSALSSKTWNQTMQKFGKEDLPKVIVIKKTPITTQKPKVIKSDLPTQNTTSAVGDIVIPSSSKQIATPKKNWFTKILDSILGSF
jgi:hypothetical protein